MGTIGPTTDHSTGTDDHPLAFEVTRLRNVVGPVVLVLFQTEKNVNKGQYSVLFAQLGGLGDAAPT